MRNAFFCNCAHVRLALLGLDQEAALRLHVVQQLQEANTPERVSK